MSPLVQTVDAEATIISAAELMCDEGIHRIIVVDGDQHPVGLISTLDIVATLVAAVKE